MLLGKKYFDFNNDYDILFSWWQEHGSFPPKREHLSQTGIIITSDNKPVCCGFLYKTDSKICVFEFVISDPKAEKEVRNAALNLLIKETKNWARENNYSLIYTSVNIPSYIKKLIDNGFTEMDKNQTHLFYQL